MAHIADDPGYFARKPWTMVLFLIVAAVAITIDVIDGNTVKTVSTVAFMGGLFGMLMLRRTQDRRYRLLAFLGFGTFLALLIIRVGLHKGWW